MITSEQIRAARALLRWTSARLAEASGIGPATIKRIELMEGVPAANVKTLMAIKIAFENAGIEFIGTPESGAGVRFAHKALKGEL